MKKLLFHICLITSFLGSSQDVEVIVSDEKNLYENKSYLVLEDLKLSEGFRYNAADGPLFFARSVILQFRDKFVTVWDTEQSGYSNLEIRIPTNPAAGPYNYTVEYISLLGDSPIINAGTFTGDAVINLPISGRYVVAISGDFPGIYFASEGNNFKLIDVKQWGNIEWSTMNSAFSGCRNLNVSAVDSPDLSSVTDMSYMFNNAKNLTADFDHWNVDNVTNMQRMFASANKFNGDVSSWNVDNVTNMEGMFSSTTAFNQDLSSWNVSNVTDMAFMFNSTGFNGNISAWDVSSVTNMNRMFFSAGLFNQDLGSWNVGNVVNMSEMFRRAWSFNRDLDNWDVGNVTTMFQMFFDARNFDGTIDSWNVSNVTDMYGMFWEAAEFRGNLDNWNVGNVTNMGRMFKEAIYFNGNIGSWNVSNVTDMTEMFMTATRFNKDISNWNVSNVTAMASMFYNAFVFNQDLSQWVVNSIPSMESMFRSARAFDQDISSWDVTNVTNMSHMFNGALKFNQDVGSWNVGNVTDMTNMFSGANLFDQYLGNWDLSSVVEMDNIFTNTNLASYNYDNTLLAWFNSGAVPSDVRLDASSLYYCDDTGKIGLNSTFGWFIYNDKQGCFSQTPFVTIWDSRVYCCGDQNYATPSNQIKIPTGPNYYDYNFKVKWEQVDDPTNNGEAGPFYDDAFVTFPSPGIYEVEITGLFPGIIFLLTNNDDQDFYKLLEVTQWGDNQWQNVSRAFERCRNLAVNASDAPDLSLITDMTYMFKGIGSINTDLSQWDVSTVENMLGLFDGVHAINGDVTGWDVSNVTDMTAMFQGAINFNQDITTWDVSNVTRMHIMFGHAYAFNQNISSWEVGNVTDMSYMFRRATSFNQDISGWDVSQVQDMSHMFTSSSAGSPAIAFNQNLGSWDISSVQDMTDMFKYSTNLSVENYDNTLIGWSTLDPGETQIPTGVTLGATDLIYCAGETARNLLTGPTYNWNIIGDILDCSSSARSPNTSVEEVLSAEEVEAANELLLYPSPSDQHFYLSGSDLVDKTLAIYDLNGKVIFEIDRLDSNNQIIDTSLIPSGIYMIKISSDKGIRERKIVIKH